MCWQIHIIVSSILSYYTAISFGPELMLPTIRFTITTVHKKIVRILTKQPYLSHNDSFDQYAAIHKLNGIHRYKTTLHAFQIKTLAALFPISTNYLTGNSHNLMPPFQRLLLIQHPCLWPTLVVEYPTFFSYGVCKDTLFQKDT